MRMAIVLLVGLGLMAAVAAAVLVQTLTATRAPVPAAGGEPQEVDVLVASRPLQAMSVVDSSAVTTKRVALSDAPVGALSNPVQVVGKVLTVPVVEGEAFNRANFAKDGSGVHLAAALPSGKRAASISLTDYTGMVGLLYPGSVVDVMISVQSGGRGGETITRTLLQGVQVLAIGAEAVTTDDTVKTGDGNNSAIRPARGDQRMVTLLVDPKQAQALQLAMQRGTLSLALRNPLDQERVQSEPTRLTHLVGQDLDEPRPALASSWFEGILDVARRNAEQQQRQERVAAADRPARSPLFENAASATDRSSSAPPPWETTIIRGTATEVRTFAAANTPTATTTATTTAKPAPAEGESDDTAGEEDPEAGDPPQLAADPVRPLNDASESSELGMQ